MVLIEAMSCGLPVVAFDCPIGPRAIIDSNKNGFLIQDENYDDFIEKLELLMQNYSLRAKIGACAKESVSKYKVDVIMDQWNNLFQNFSSN
jgi:glycosyltransferase involved in cell wall biosynthesis